MPWIGFFSTLIAYLQSLFSPDKWFAKPPQKTEEENLLYSESVKKIFFLLDDKNLEEATKVAREAGISSLDFEDLRTIHFWDWNNNS